MDIIARLRLNGEGFSSDFRGRFAEMESAASASARRMTGILKGVTPPPLSAESSASAFISGKAAADGMLASVDPLFAAQLRYNQQIAKANELHATGMLTTANYSRIQAGLKTELDQATSAQQRQVQASGMARAGYQQLSFQIGDVSQQLALGINPAVVFGQQMGQVAQALALIEGGKTAAAGDSVSSLKDDFDEAAGAIEQAQGATEQLSAVLGAGATATEGNSAATGANAASQEGRTAATGASTAATNSNTAATGANAAAAEADAVATTGLAAAKARLVTFLAGPWGAALIGAVTVIGMLASKTGEATATIEEEVKKLERNAAQTEITRQAKEAYERTLPGLIGKIREETEALEAQNRTLEENQRRTLEGAETNLTNLRIAARTVELQLRDARAEVDRARGTSYDPEGIAATTVLRGRQRIADLEEQLRLANQSVARAETAIGEARVALVRGQAADAAQAMGDGIARINQQYNEQVRNAERAAVATHKSVAALLAETNAINARRAVAIAAERERQRIAERERDAEIGSLRRPVGGSVLSPYGVWRQQSSLGPHRHAGVDLNADPGTPVVAPGGGMARRRSNPGGLGWYVEIRMDNGLRAVLGHLSGYEIPEGGAVRVEQGQTVGRSGGGMLRPGVRRPGAGNATGTPHLHYELWRGRQTVDPMAGGQSLGAQAARAEEESRARIVQLDQREEQARARIVTQMEGATAEAAEQARFSDLRARGLDDEATLEERLSEKREAAAERLKDLREVAAERGRSGPEQDALVAGQQQISAGLQEQLGLYEAQAAAFARLLMDNREREHLTDEQRAAEEAASAAMQQTLTRAQAIGVTVEDNLQIELALVRAGQARNVVLERAGQLRQKEAQAAQADLEEQERELEGMKEDMRRREEEQYRELAALWGDLMRGNVDDIWDRFKEAGIDAIAEIAAQWSLAMMTGQHFDLGGTMAGMGQSGGFGPLGTILGAFGKGGGATAGGEGLWGSLMGGGGAGAGGAAGAMSAVSSAVPYVTAALAAFSILKSLGAFSSTKRGSATLGYSGGELSAGATRGNSSSYIAASSSAMDSVGNSLERIADMLGGDVTGAGSVSLGQRDGKWRGDPTGRGITKTKKGAIDFGDDQEAAIRWAISEALRDGVIGGISDAAKRLLQSGKDLEKAIEKAVMVEEIPKLLKARLDPVGAALDELYEKWEKTVAALNEGGASVEQMAEAQQLYKLELEDTIAKTASASASLKEFLDSLKMGSDSPYSLRQQEETARAALQPFLDKIAAGESVDQDQYQQTAQTYLDIERQLYGSTDQFFTAMDMIMAATNKAIERIDSAVPIRTAVDPFVEATAANTGTLTEQNEGIQSTLDQILATLRGGGSTTAANDFIGGGSGFFQVRSL